jgi:hypothetical protein
MSRPSDIEIANAREIVRAMMLWKWVEMGLKPGPVSDLESYALREMLDAAHMIRDFGEEKNDNGTTDHMVFPADRLIAALYCITHWQANDPDACESIVIGHNKALLCVVAP